jgi:hypothetical protein
MSFFNAEKSRFSGISSPTLHTSLRLEQGCVQCGSRLEPVEFGKFNFSGKCFNCSVWISEDDEVFEDLEDLGGLRSLSRSSRSIRRESFLSHCSRCIAQLATGIMIYIF